MTCLEKDNRPPFGLPATVASVALAAIALVAAGCDSLTSRTEIQEANKLYGEGQFRKAVEKYAGALARSPDLTIGHHNAGLAYYKMFQPGVDTPENKQAAQKATTHFETYLKKYPDDQKIISLLTTIWLDSDQYDKAIAYWEQVLAKNPGSRDILLQLANINRQAGNFKKAYEWHTRRIALEKDEVGKAKVYVDIAKMQWSRLQKPDLVDRDRIAVTDVGIAALAVAETLDPKNIEVQGYTAAMYQHRSLAHGASWAAMVENASWRHYSLRAQKLKAARTAPAASGAGGGTSPTPSGNPTPPGPK